MKVKEESLKTGWKQHSKNKDHGIGSNHFMVIDGESRETVRDYFLGLQITADGDCSHEIKTLAPQK